MEAFVPALNPSNPASPSNMSSEETIACDAYEQPKLWKCGGPDQVKIPRPDGNLWKACLEPLLEEDRLKCEAWKDEVYNLLIFAGLFSAVVTAFVIESYQYLQPDQNYDVVVLLTRIASSLEHTSSNLPQNWTTNDTPPSSSSIRVNIYWFLSLILSLITVLVGIVSLQWLRESQRYPSNLSSKAIFAMRTMRAEAFDQWFVPQIFAGLPLLLQSALVLFLVGLVDFLLHLNRTVAIPVIILIAFAFSFLLVTSALPSLQYVWTVNTSKRSSVPAQCPYKSPQSWAFLRLSSSSIIRGATSFVGMFLLNFAVVHLSPVVLISRLWKAEHHVWSLLDRLELSLQLKYLGTLKNWNDYDNVWLDERHRIATRSTAEYFESKIGNPDLDAARGIAHIINSEVREERMAFTVYHCFQELPPAVVEAVLNLMTSRTKAISSGVHTKDASRLAPFLKNPSDEMLRDENEFLLLEHLPHSANEYNVSAKRQLEVFLRSLAYVFTDDSRHHSSSFDAGISESSAMKDGQVKLLVPNALKSVKGFASLPEPLSTDVKEQLILMYESLVNLSFGPLEPELSPACLCFREDFLGDFMQLMHIVTLSLIISTSSERNTSLLSNFTGLITRLTDSLRFSNVGSAPIQPNGYHRGAYQPQPWSTTIIASKKVAFHISILYLSSFDYMEWAHIRHLTPQFANAFKGLVSAAHSYERRFVGQVEFALNHSYHSTKWRHIVRTVLPEGQAGRQ